MAAPDKADREETRGAPQPSGCALPLGQMCHRGRLRIHALTSEARQAIRRGPKRAARRVAFTRCNVFLRDRFTCQYCGEAFASSALTFEHVIPRSCGGQTTWSNIVTACVPCNTGKGNSLRIKPRRVPKEPTLNELLAAKRSFPPGLVRPCLTACRVEHRLRSQTPLGLGAAPGSKTPRSTHAICMGPEPGRRVTRSGPISLAGV